VVNRFCLCGFERKLSGVNSPEAPDSDQRSSPLNALWNLRISIKTRPPGAKHSDRVVAWSLLRRVSANPDDRVPFYSSLTLKCSIALLVLQSAIGVPCHQDLHAEVAFKPKAS
jgi:hypothetical protein